MTAAPRAVLFRVDASAAIGTGHVRRCLSLADAVARIGGAPHFITRDLGGGAAAAIRAAGFPVTVLAPPDAPFRPATDDPPHAAWAGVEWARDAEETLAAPAPRPVVVVVDIYALDARWHRAVAAASGARIVALDDLADRPLAAALVIDHNPAAAPRDRYAGRLAPGGSVLGGLRYALLADVYAAAPRHVVPDTVGTIGISMGGIDLAGLSLPIATALRSGGFQGTIRIAATSANPHLPALVAAAREGTVALTLDAPNLADFYGMP